MRWGGGRGVDRYGKACSVLGPYRVSRSEATDTHPVARSSLLAVVWVLDLHQHRLAVSVEARHAIDQRANPDQLARLKIRSLSALESLLG